MPRRRVVRSTRFVRRGGRPIGMDDRWHLAAEGKERLRLPADGWPTAAAFSLGALTVLALGAASGGYFASSWGWTLLVFAAVLFWEVGAREMVRPTAMQAVFVGGFLALAGWAVLSSTWSTANGAVTESVRTLVYAGGAAAAIAMTQRRSPVALVSGMLAGASAVVGYGLATRLIPDRIGTYDALAGVRLARPIGYWNAFGLLCAISILLALALATRLPPRLAALAGMPVSIFAVALYFTFSRGSWVALALGIAVALGISPHRLRVTVVAVALAAPCAVGVWLASRSVPLTHLNIQLSRAAHDGHRLAVAIVLLSLVAGGTTAGAVVLMQRVTVRTMVARAYAIALVAALISAAGFGLVLTGGPVGAAHRIWHSFSQPPPPINGDLRKHLLNLSGSGRVDLWRAALQDAQAHPVVGSGAGSYETYWLAHRPTAQKVRDAHSLYLETFAELGIVGLALLAIALGAPLVAAFRARREPLVPAIAGCYVAYLAHAAVDWDWELSAVTLMAVFCGVVLFACEKRISPRPLGRRVRYAVLGLTLPVMAVAFAWLVGNMNLSRASSAASQAKWSVAARDAHRAATWLPWSSQPWQQLGEAELAQGHLSAAQKSFGTAIKQDTHDWTLWFDLARASTGNSQRAALGQAAKLNPLSPEIATFRSELGSQAGISITVPGVTP
jgi:MFS family permease